MTLGIPSTPGIPKSVTKHTLAAQYNHIEEVETLFKQYKGEIAAATIESIAGNMGFVSCCHRDDEIAKILNAADEVFKIL